VSEFFPARTIAKARRTNVNKVRYQARRERWPVKRQGKRVEYKPPFRLQKQLSNPLNEPRLLRELLRAAAVAGFMLEMRRNARIGIEQALVTTASRYRRVFQFSARALRRWLSLVQRNGLAGLQERKAGTVGRKPMRLERILR
jgi:hypothetical protein